MNWPSLNDEERKLIGTIYKQVSPFEAQKRGAALVAANIARHIEREVIDKPRQWQPLAYCWRGGKRSGSLALVLGQIGFRVSVIEGGYKAFRSAILADLPQLVARLDLRVVCGPTGSGKTRLLQALDQAGAPGAGPGGAGQPPQLGAGPDPRASRSPRRSASTPWCGTGCAASTRPARCSWKAKAARWATWRCPRP